MGTVTTSTPEIAVTSVRIERAKLDRFKDVAAEHRRSVSQEIRWLIDRAIAENDRSAA